MSQSEATIRHIVNFAPPSQAEPEKPKKPEPGPEGAGISLLFLLLVFLIAALLWWFLGTPGPMPPPPIVASGQGVVDVNEVNLRERPSTLSGIKFVLPRGTKVEALGQHHRTAFGTIWVKVRVNTREGVQEGWVDNRYVLRT